MDSTNRGNYTGKVAIDYTEGLYNPFIYKGLGYLGIVQERRELEDTIIKLRKELQETKTSEESSSKIANRLFLTLSKYHLLTRVNRDAQKMILESDEFSKQFSENSNCAVFVISIDIRRSTELMLRSRSAQQFADFMTKLCSGFKSIIEENFGVFDKFTGDGVLAFFPEFFSGKDAGFYTISAADRCHKLFEKTYKEFRSSFVSIIADTGLGIGIDYGTVRFVQMAEDLTVIGEPVVYACRIGGAAFAGKTFLNQLAYEKVIERFNASCVLIESEIKIKNDGPILAYEVQLNGKEYKPLVPDWVKNAGGKSGL